MALQSTITDPVSGARTSKAYISVPRIQCRYSDGDLIDVRLAVWASPKAKADGLAPVREFWLQTTLAELAKFARKTDGADLRKPVYRWLKKRAPDEGQVDLRGAENI